MNDYNENYDSSNKPYKAHATLTNTKTRTKRLSNDNIIGCVAFLGFLTFSMGLITATGYLIYWLSNGSKKEIKSKTKLEQKQAKKEENQVKEDGFYYRGKKVYYSKSFYEPFPKEKYYCGSNEQLDELSRRNTKGLREFYERLDNSKKDGNGFKSDNKKNEEEKFKAEFAKRKLKKDLNKLYSPYMTLNTGQLMKLRSYFLEMEETKLIEHFNKIYKFNIDNFKMKNREEIKNFDLNCLFFIKIAFDKDYPNLLQEILDKGFDINYWKINYLSPLLYAAQLNSNKCIDVLSKYKTDFLQTLNYEAGNFYSSYTDNCTPNYEILYKIRYLKSKDNSGKEWGECILNLDDKKEKVKEIKENEIEEKLDLGCTILHFAAKNGNIPLAQKVMNLGINKNHKSCKGNTPLLYAVKSNQYDMVSFLLKNGANIDDKIIQATSDQKMLELLNNQSDY